MADRYVRHAPDPAWKARSAFGLPPGSIRALLALAIAATVWGSLVMRPDREVPAYLRDLMFIILGHYFAVRGRSRSRPEPRPEGDDPETPPPLYLPRGSVRAALVLGFITVAVVLVGENRLGPVGTSPASVTLMLVGGFLLGALFKVIASRIEVRPDSPWPRRIEDAKAFVSIVAATLLVTFTWDSAWPFLPESLTEALPRLGEQGPEHLAGAWIGFYFGSR